MSKSQDASLYVVLVIGAVVGVIFSIVTIHGPVKNVTVPQVTALPSNFPDVKNDPTYSSFLNAGAIDPTQAVQVGNSTNSSPFNGSQ